MKRLISILLAAVMVLSLSACGGSSASSAPASGSGDASSAPASSSAATNPATQGTIYGLDRADTMVLGMVSDIKGLDPMLCSTRLENSMVHMHICDTLGWRDDQGIVTPRLAKSWEMIDDTTWQFVLQEGVVAHDGSKLTSEDVKYSMERCMSDPSFAQYQLPAQVGLEEVVIIDELTFQFKLKAPTNVMDFWLFEAPILPKSYYEGKTSDQLDGACGYGPYKLVEWVRDDHVTLEAFEDYWQGAPQIKNVVFRVIPEESARINELLAGSIDFAEQISIDIADQANSDFTHLDAREGLRKLQLTMSIEKGNPALKDVRVRQALNYAVDKESICENILSGYTSPYSSYVNPANNNPALKAYPYDPEKAKALLAEAGYAEGLELKLVSPSSRYGLDKEVTMQMAADLEAVGVKVTCEYMELGVFLEKLDARELTDLVWIGWAALVNPVVENLILTTGHVDNSATYSNPEFDALYQQLASSMDKEEQQKLNFQMQEIVWNDCPWLFGWKLPQLHGVNNRVEWDIRCDGYFDVFNAKLV